VENRGGRWVGVMVKERRNYVAVKAT